MTTPGPWKAQQGIGNHQFLSPRIEIVADGELPERGEILAVVVNSEDEANARLIAAAPDLLRALDVCETALALEEPSVFICADEGPSGERCGECLGCTRHYAKELAQAAIAKARVQP